MTSLRKATVIEVKAEVKDLKWIKPIEVRACSGHSEVRGIKVSYESKLLKSTAAIVARALHT